MGKQKKTTSVRRSFAFADETLKQLDFLAEQQHIPTSELVRRYVHQGMTIEKTKDDIDFIRKNIREELSAISDYNTNRLIGILVKIGSMTVTMCYFSSKLMHVLIAKYDKEIKYTPMFEEAKKKASYFLSRGCEMKFEEACKEFLSEKNENRNTT